MKLQQAKIILEKINRLYQSMTLDENVDVFEKELMLSYIRQLYTAFSGDQLAAKASKPAAPATPPEPKAQPPKPATKAKVSPPPAPKPEPEPIKPVAATPPAPPKPVTPPPAAPPPAAPKPEPVTAKVETPVAPEPRKEAAPKPPKPVAVPKPAVLKAEVPKASPKPLSEEHEVLFEHQEATDLGEKLSQSPIKDLRKSMGINEKILTVKELFGGDQKLFDDTVNILNGFSNFEQAKEFLSKNIASELGWVTKEKRKKARVFIKLVRRRYK